MGYLGRIMAVILGTTGMLGSMVKRIIPDATELNRPQFNAENLDKIAFTPGERVVNCIGVIKPHCHNVQSAIKVNALFPHYLPQGTIQIATDCVFSGSKGNYSESDLHDADDVYGKTKSLGEAKHLNNLRCSIIGPELKNHLSLFDWLKSQNGTVNGFTNHRWNGLTTLHYASIVTAILKTHIPLPTLQHLVPADSVTKDELLAIIADEFNLNIRIKKVEASQAVDRTLTTNNPDLNKRLWRIAGYSKPPTVKRMIKELAEYIK
jgi:dTDP-4-dehydrorhamnose reductase